MPPRLKNKIGSNPDAWWQNAYDKHPDIEAEFEYQFGNDTLVPGTKFRIKYMRGEFKFRCFARNTRTGAEWIDCLEGDAAFRSFRADRIQRVVKPKRPRRKKASS
ncbi:hypothetical protein PP460_gp170 [Streptomyces phage Muntaha]|uniref:DUF7246 domain-containing protein n=1 Tax=Streptomyces phage Muntaha TaxID=2713269 RepID=A0A6G8R380_9CAUD|nr:hypothetical protein PP460_gp170 [Streptomyces phage Muntaha]QIN94633.1 hypothetical protein SEA_MUNTAHA_77 [Streptomyces phage Muntaha]